jgi:hypothetical protein
MVGLVALAEVAPRATIAINAGHAFIPSLSALIVIPTMLRALAKFLG